jgi:hypothetical protein
VSNFLVQNDWDVDIQYRQTNKHRIRAIASFLTLLLGSTSLHADRILVIGASNSAPLVPELQAVFNDNGHTEIIVDVTPFVCCAWRMRTIDELNHISTWLDERPDVIVVQIGIGVNDWQAAGWIPSWADTAAERSLIAGIIRNVEVVVDHIFSLRPDIQIMWVSGDFPRPYQLGTPLEINTFLLKFAEQRAQFADTIPGLSFVDTHGTLQVTFGFDGIQHTQFDPGFVIPPGDPSLPNPGLPSPFGPMIPDEPFHRTPEGHKAIAQALYDLFYEPLLNGEGFEINAGHAGAWFNPATSGQGQFIDVEPEKQFMFVSWFTYTDAASANPFEQRWLTAEGNYAGNTANLTLYETLGGRFDDPQAVNNTQVGEVSLVFGDCGQGQMTYSLDAEGLQGSFPLLRVIPGSGNVCDERSGITTQAVDIDAGMDGAWFDPNTSGQGFFIDSYLDPEGSNFIFVAWFTYGDDTASGQRWLTAEGSFEGSIAEMDVFETTGGSFDDPQIPSTTKVGTMSLDFTDCANAQLTYSLLANGAEGDIAITRVVPGGQALCEELTKAE